MGLKNFLVIMGIMMTTAVYAEQKTVTLESPDRAVKLEFFTEGSVLQYRLTSQGTVILLPSAMLWEVDGKQLGSHVEAINVLRRYSGNQRYETRGGHSETRDNHKGLVLNITEKDGQTFQVEARVYPDGIAFRYLSRHENSVSVNDHTTFCLPEETIIWAQDNWKHYEGAYRKYPLSALPGNLQAGPPVTVKYPSGIYSVITEGGLTDFGGMSLRLVNKNTFESVIDGKTTLQGEIAIPWRVVMTGDLQSLINNDIVSHVSPPLAASIARNKAWIKPGKCVWSWLANYPVTFENMKKFSDWGSELGFEYNLVDEGWSHWNEDGKDSWQLVKELVDYSAAKNVKILLWKAYPDRKGIDGIRTPEKRRAFFEKCKALGVAGLKIDFFDAETQDVIKYYQETLEEAAEFGLLINFHGCNKPTGATRTYPNEVSREGILGLEYGSSWADQNTVTPFTRFLAGHGDYTALTFDKGMMGETTAAHQIATTVIFTSPLLCYGGAPADYLAHPAKEMIKAIPTTWDETKVIEPTEIGESVVIARRKGKEWFVAAITMNSLKGLSIPLAFLGKKTYTCSVVKDHPEEAQQVVLETRKLTGKDVLSVDMKKAGGFVVRFVQE